MNRLSFPKKWYVGLKILWKTCNRDNAKSKHYDNQIYRVRIYVPVSIKLVKTRVIVATEYDNAVLEAIAFKKELNANDCITIENTLDAGIEEGNDYSVCFHYLDIINI